MPSDGTEQRKLAAIMFTDMVGYSALAQRNEALALELLEEHRRVLRSIFPKHNGREIETAGDAFLVEFLSALEAVRCAVEIQEKLSERNRTTPAERAIRIRIGIHVGDVVHLEGKVMGDAVNIAARIEPLAQAGGICISNAVYDQIENKVEHALVQLSKPELKNIQASVEVYRLVLDGTVAGDVRSRTRAGSPPSASSPWRVRGALTVGVILLAALSVFLFLKSGSRPKSSTSATNASPAATAVADQKSIAVLPFVNMSADKDNEYLSDGITEELCTALTQVRGLRVPARTSCFVFKGKTDDIRKIGQQLNVATVLEGSVSQSGTKLRINARLISVADGFHLWATNYDREMSDLLALRSEIAQQVVAAMRVQLLPGEKQQLVKKGTENPEAHRLYLLGRSLWNQRNGDGLKKAVDYFQQALVQDADYALAYVGLADCYIVLPTYSDVSSREAMPKAHAAALTALKLDDSLGEARAALGYVREFEWDWQGAESEYRQGIGLTPNYANIHQRYCVLLVRLGRLDEANREARLAQSLDPLSPLINTVAGYALYYRGEYDQALTAFRTVLELNPDYHGAHMGLGDAYLMRQMFSEAITEIQTYRASAGKTTRGLGNLGYAYGVSGREEEARKVLDELISFSMQGYEAQYQMALVYNGLGDRVKTWSCFEEAIERREDGIFDLKANPLWRNLRSERRFIALLKKMGLDK